MDSGEPWEGSLLPEEKAISDPTRSYLVAEASLLWLFLRLSRTELQLGALQVSSLACDSPRWLFWDEGGEGRQHFPPLPSQLLLLGKSDIC